MASLQEAHGQMLAAGMPEFPLGHPTTNLGKITRYGPKKKAWYRLEEIRAEVPKGSGNYVQVVVGSFGMWGQIDSTKIDVDWKGMSAEARAELQRKTAEAEAAERAKREERAHLAANRAAQQWKAGTSTGVSPYLQRKGVEPVRGLKFFKDGTLLVPMLRYGPEGLREKPALIGLQKIGPDGDKKFNKGIAKDGAFCRLGPGPKGPAVIVVCEGVATGLSIGQALDWKHAVVVAFDAYSLLKVGRELRRLYPDSPLLFCADDDFLTDGNPGITMARRAADALKPARVVVPLFRFRLENKWTDFNDLHVHQSLEDVREQVLEAVAELEAQPPKPISPPGAATAGGGSGDDDSQHWWAGLLKNSEGGVKGNWQNVAYAIEHNPLLSKLVGVDEFATCLVALRPPPWAVNGQSDPRKYPREWNDADDSALGMWLSFSCFPRLVLSGVDGYRAGVNAAALKCKTHPLREWLKGLEWDKTPRLDDWLADICHPRMEFSTSREYLRLVGRWFLIGAVARVLRPGCKLDHAPIFEGAQGQGKSTLLAVLAGDYFADTPFVMGDTNSYLALKGKWIYEIAELDSFNRSEQTRAKAFMTSAKDSYRAPYERRVADHPRQCVFAGTTNADEYFKDATGNRRYWPIRVGEVNLEALANMREQLFAEAVHCFLEGERYWPLRDEQDRIFSPEQESREIGDARLHITANWLDGLDRHGEPVLDWSKRDRVTTADILFDCWHVEYSKVDNTKALETKAGQIMQALKWERKRDASTRQRYYVRPAEPKVGEPARAGAGVEAQQGGGDVDIPF